MYNIKFYRLSYGCIIVNLFNNTLFAIMGLMSDKVVNNKIFNTASGIVFLSNIIMPILLTILGIVAMVISISIKETTTKKASIGGILNIIYFFLWLFIVARIGQGV